MPVFSNGCTSGIFRKMKNRKLVGGIYFDEVSEQVNDWLTIYLNFDDVDVSIEKLDTTTTLSICYRGRGSYLLPSGGHASTSLDYTWTVLLFGVKTKDDLNNTGYREVSISIHKTRIFDRRKIIVKNNEGRKILTLYAKKVVLDNVVTEDVIAKKKLLEAKKQANKEEVEQETFIASNKEKEVAVAHNKTSKVERAIFLSIEVALVAGASYVMHRFLSNHMTAVEILFMYGLLGFLMSGTLDNKIEKILPVLLAVAFLSVLPYTTFTIGIFLIYLFVFRKLIKAKQDVRK